MERLLGIGLANVAMAGVFAVVAAVVARWCGRPALVASLWALVLLKLLTPPLWGVKVGWLSRAAAEGTPGALPEVAAPRAASSGFVAEDGVATWDVTGEVTAEGADVAAWESVTTPESHPVPAAAKPKMSRALSQWLLPGAALVWGLGSLVCLIVVVARVVRFTRLLGYAELAPRELQGRTRALAGRMGVRSAPGVWFVPGVVCPLMWAGFGRAMLLVPRELWRRLDAAGQDSLLAHELAHLGRRDHWVRMLEVAATVLYWWYPVTWWARARLREAEEQCCDAWVVWALPGGDGDYARALLETVEFVSGRGGGFLARPAVPALASGMGQFHQLARRLTMIKSRRVPRKLSWFGRVGVCALALAWLPLAPTRAQVDAGKPDEPVAPQATPDASMEVPDPAPAASAEAPVPVEPPSIVALPAPAALPAPVALPPRAALPAAVAPAATPAAPRASIVEVETEKAAETAPEGADDEKSVIENLKAKRNAPYGSLRGQPPEPRVAKELDAARERVKQLEQQLQSAQRRLAELEGQARGRTTTLTITRDGENEKIIELDANTGRIIRESTVRKDAPGPMKPAKTRSAFPGSTGEPFLKGPAGPQPNPMTQNQFLAPSKVNKMPDRSSMSRERRLDELESNLKALLDEVKAIKDEDARRSDSAPKPKTY